MDFHLSTHLYIEGLQFDLFIGCEESERKARQPVEVTLWIYFPRPPLGCISDELKDTVCYAKCAEIIEREVVNRHFNLVEHLAYTIHKALKKELPMQIEIVVRVKKLHPPLYKARRGISFVYFPEKEDHAEKKKLSRDWD